MTTAQLIAYYVDLLILQYGTQPNAQATVSLIVGELIQNQIATEVQDAFDIATAVGVQLDVLASYRGLTRYVYGFNANQKFFSMPSYVAPTVAGVGFQNYASPPNGGFFLTYGSSSVVVYTMTDDELRQVLAFKCVADSMFLSEETLDNLMFQFFGSQEGYYDQFNMSVIFIEPVIDTSTIFPLAWALGIIPRAAGVQYNLVRAPTSDLFSLPSYTNPHAANEFGFTNYSGTVTGGSFVRYPS
jgi:hypothetical protein